MDQDHFTLCIDGASKGNPRVTGSGGVLYDPGGNIENTYSWNLGVATNNQAESYALLQGLFIARLQNIKSLLVVGDSKNTIRHLRRSCLIMDVSLKSIVKCIYYILKDFEQVFPWHITWELNYLPHNLANIGVKEEASSLNIDRNIRFLPAP